MSENAYRKNIFAQLIGFTDRQLVGKICHCTELLKNKTC